MTLGIELLGLVLTLWVVGSTEFEDSGFGREACFWVLELTWKFGLYVCFDVEDWWNAGFWVLRR